VSITFLSTKKKEKGLETENPVLYAQFQEFMHKIQAQNNDGEKELELGDEEYRIYH
jgi:hypothetical protein